MKRLGMGIMVVALLLAVAAAPAGAKPAPKVAMLKSTGLFNGEHLHITARHEAPELQYLAAECTSNFPAGGRFDCTQLEHTTSGDSTYKFKGHALTGPVGDESRTCGTSEADNDCIVAVMPYNGGTHVWDTADAATIPISFNVPS